MKRPTLKSALTALGLLLVASLSLCASEAPKRDADLVAKIFSSIEKSDYAAFTADGNEQFKKLDKATFDGAMTQVLPKFKAGYTASYLGELKQKGFHVTLWKLSFKDGSDDLLATLCVKDGKVGGFWLK